MAAQWIKTAATAMLCAVSLHAADEKDYYPEITWKNQGQVLEVGGLTLMKDGRVMIATRRGELIIAENPLDPKGDIRYKQFAFGLAQPLGVLEHDGSFYVAQRGELTRITDSNGDDRADLFETVCDGWEISGSYHEYNFGPSLGPDGNFYVTLNKPFGPEPFGRARWRGWAVRITPQGEMTGIAMGLRSPAGQTFSPWGELFYTDNQGEWCNASKLSLIKPGDYHGHPHSVPDTKEPDSPIRNIPEPKSGTMMGDVAQQIPTFRMPAVWFPYRRIGQSPAGLVWDQSQGKFGPFAGQIFVGDQQSSLLMRVALEKVNGHWQGACFHFRDGLQCGVTRVEALPDGSLLTGQTERGWGALGEAPYGLQRIVWTGRTPFEMHDIKALPDGFEVAFTQPADARAAGNPASWKISSYSYQLRSQYGGPDEQIQALPVSAATVGADGRSVRLAVDGLRAGFVHELTAPGVKSATGESLLHNVGWYTLVEIPGTPLPLTKAGNWQAVKLSEPGMAEAGEAWAGTVGSRLQAALPKDAAGQVHVAYRLAADGAAALSLLSRSINLADGSVENGGRTVAAAVPALNPAGEWQHLHIQYQTTGGGVLLARVYLNQRLIHQNLNLPGKNPATELVLAVTGGTVEAGAITLRTIEDAGLAAATATVKPAADGLVHAKFASIEGGGSERYESAADRQCIGWWASTRAVALWSSVAVTPGTYDVFVRQALLGADGARVAVKVAGEELFCKTKSTPEWDKFIDVPVGRVTIKDDEPVSISVQGQELKGKHLFNLRGVVLKPAKR